MQENYQHDGDGPQALYVRSEFLIAGCSSCPIA